MRGGLEVLAATLDTTQAGARRWLIETTHAIRVATICDLRRLYPQATVAKLARAVGMTKKSAALHLRDAGLIAARRRSRTRAGDGGRASHKLSPAQLAEVERLVGRISDQTLADRFGVSRSTIQYHRRQGGMKCGGK